MNSRKYLKPILHRVLPPLTRWYLRKERSYTYQDLRVQVPPGVFHPGLYHSTKHMLKHLERYDLAGKTVLEIGGGSGLVSIWCARQGAQVTVTDVSHAAIAAMQQNATANQVELEVIHSDLFTNLPPRQFDFILLNPPFYQGKPEKEEEYAWYAGPQFEYFHLLFAELKAYRRPDSKLLMILSEDCDLAHIRGIAKMEHWSMEVIQTMRSWGEWLYMYELRYLRVG